MKKQILSVVIVLLFLSLLIGAVVLLNYVWPPYPGPQRSTTVEGTIEKITYPNDSAGSFIIKLDEFYEIYRTRKFAYRLFEDTEVIFGDHTISALELKIGDVVRITGLGAKPNPVGKNDPVGFIVWEQIELMVAAE